MQVQKVGNEKVLFHVAQHERGLTNWAIQRTNRVYLYHSFFDNCSFRNTQKFFKKVYRCL